MKLKLFVWKTLAVFSVLLCLAEISCTGQTNVDLVPQGNSSDQQNQTDPDPNQNPDSGDTQNVYYTITFKTDHGTTPKSIQVLDGTELSSDDLPVRRGCTSRRRSGCGKLRYAPPTRRAPSALRRDWPSGSGRALRPASRRNGRFPAYDGRSR